MGKKVREYKSGDFIFAKVKGYPAWPARVQKLNGKKYFVYFYGTGETANLPPNMIFDYVENKDKFLTKTQKRKDFIKGVEQIQHDFANNIPLEDVIGVPMEVGPADDSANDSAINDTMDETVADTTANDTVDDEANTMQNDTAVEDSDDTGALIIDEGKAPKSKKAKPDPKTPATPKAKEAKTPRGKAKKDEKPADEEEEKPEEIVSRSGRKIRPKRYIDEQTEENSTLPSPAPRRKRGASPVGEKEKEIADPKEKDRDTNIKSFNAVSQSELEDLKASFKPEDAEKENILIAYLPSGKYVGIKLFQSRPHSFKNEASRLQWDKQAASNAITLRMQLERGQISAMAVQGQLVMDLNLSDEEKTALDKERETDEKKYRVQFLRTEMKLIELDAKIKTCLSLEKADTDVCLKLLNELQELDIKPLMLLKHPTCLETVKRMRAYVGNTPSWDLSESAALNFSKQAHRIRKAADALYKKMKELFTTPDGLQFWEFFSERVLQFKQMASKLGGSELLELVHEPLEMSQPTSYTMKSAVDAANEEQDDEPPKKKSTPAAKSKKPVISTPAKGKRQSSRKQAEKPEGVTEMEDTPQAETEGDSTGKDAVDNPKEAEVASAESTGIETEPAKEPEVEPTTEDTDAPAETAKTDKKDAKKGAKNAKEGKKILRSDKNPKIDKTSEKAKNTENSKDADSSKDDNEIEKEVAKTPEKTLKSPKKSKEDKNLKSDKSDDNVSIDDKKDDNVSKDDENDDKYPDDKEISPKETEKVSEVEDSKEIEADDKTDDAKEAKSAKDKKESKKSDKNGNDKPGKDNDKSGKDNDKSDKSNDKSGKDNDKSDKSNDKSGKDNDKSVKDNGKPGKDNDKSSKDEKTGKDIEKSAKDTEKIAKDSEKSGKDTEKSGKDGDKSGKEGEKSEKRKADEEDKAEQKDEPRAKRSRDSKKTEPPPPRSPAKRKAKV